MNFNIVLHRCQCHPETCSCARYRVVMGEKEEQVAQFYFRKDAEKLVKLLERK
jgi:hypothetical protein